jgi:Domain of unknown function (DUF4160)
MPEISRFLGIVIAMFYNDHEPMHFHAIYGDFEALIEIETGRILQGSLPSRALNHVVEWHGIHREELVENWNLARERVSLKSIQPLE